MKTTMQRLATRLAPASVTLALGFVGLRHHHQLAGLMACAPADSLPASALERKGAILAAYIVRLPAPRLQPPVATCVSIGDDGVVVHPAHGDARSLWVNNAIGIGVGMRMFKSPTSIVVIGAICLHTFSLSCSTAFSISCRPSCSAGRTPDECRYSAVSAVRTSAVQCVLCEV